MNMICCLEGETEGLHLVDLMSKCQGASTLESIEIGNELMPVESGEVLSVLQGCREMFFNKLGKTHANHKILTKETQSPPSRPYRAKVQEQIHTEIHNMLNLGVIKECSWSLKKTTL